jgi:hypothetical protein
MGATGDESMDLSDYALMASARAKEMCNWISFALSQDRAKAKRDELRKARDELRKARDEACRLITYLTQAIDERD